jgi:formylglycine-generating enzyme required for sulfatase activity
MPREDDGIATGTEVPGSGPLPLPEVVAIPAGRLETVGGEARRTIEIRAFRLGRTPVTNRDYSSFLATGRVAPPPWWADPHFSSPRQPVVGVSWEEAMACCAWLSEVSGGTWRLPTEAEWEFAARGGLAAPRTAWGDTVPEGEIPAGALAAPWETGRGRPNGYGLLDIGTVVHEWCLNWHDENSAGGERRAGPRRRASRGGSWRHRIRWSPPSARSSLPPGYRYSDYGFRVLQEAQRNTASTIAASRTSTGGACEATRGPGRTRRAPGTSR